MLSDNIQLVGGEAQSTMLSNGFNLEYLFRIRNELSSFRTYFKQEIAFKKD